MPLHLKELQKHTEQNEQIIKLLTTLNQTQQPKKEVVSNKTQPRGNKNESRKQRPTPNGKLGSNSNQ